MSKRRISVVQYLNTAPLVRGFTRGALRGKYELSFTVPSQCAEALRAGDADVAIIPAIEYQRIPNLVILPGLSIASKRRVRSLLLIAKRPMREVRSIALDRSSRSTQALTRILCVRHWRISPDFHEAAPDLAAMLADSDAALLIGDPALRLAIATAAPTANANHSGIQPPTGMVVMGSLPGLPGIGPLYIYDVVEEWRAMTRLPAVLAVWATRSEIATPELIAEFQASRDSGVSQIPQIANEASGELALPAQELARYLSENIDFSLDAENFSGLERYFREAADLGLIGRVKPITMAAAQSAGARAI